MDKRIGKRDLLLLAVILAAAFVLWGGWRLAHRGAAAAVEVTVDGKVYGTYELAVDREIPITKDGKVTNTLVIRDGKADMTEADCPDLLCVHQKPISASGETIVCLPNRVVAEVVGKTGQAEFDAIAN